jgi:hypothetical protein
MPRLGSCFVVASQKDAENQLPQLDAKEGQFLQMEDYNSNRHWSLRYKWWPNNKSRMYLLESAGMKFRSSTQYMIYILHIYAVKNKGLHIHAELPSPTLVLI